MKYLKKSSSILSICKMNSKPFDSPFFKSLLFVFIIAMSPGVLGQEQWFPIGPAAIKDGQTYGGGRIEVSGRATVIAVNPENPQDVWLGTSNGGVWHSTNAGLPAMSWKPMTDALPSLAIGAITLKDCNSTRCNTIYIGTGENNIRRHTYYGRGVYKLEWVGGEFAGYYPEELGTTSEFFKYGAVNDIVIDGTTMFVSISEGRASSAAQVTVIAPQPTSGYGVFKSTNEGEDWVKMEGTGNALPTDMELIDGELYCGFSGKGIFRLNGTQTSWCPLNPGNTEPVGCSIITSTLPNTSEIFDHVEIAAAPSNEQIIFAVFGKCPSVTLTNCEPEVYRSSNGGDSWDKLNYTSTGEQPMKSYTRYTHALTVHPTNPDILLYGGLTINRSEDGGNTFTTIGDASTHPDHQDLVYATASDPELLYGVNDGGFYFSFDGGECWNSGNYDLQITSFYSIDANTQPITGTSTVPSLVIGGSQDNGSNLFNGSRMWQHVLDADGGDCDIQNPSIMFASAQRFGPYRTLNGPSLSNFDQFQSGLDVFEDVAFYPPYLQHPTTNEVYFGAETLYRTSGSGAPNWQAISPDFDSSLIEYPPIETRNVISAVALSETDPDRIYVGLYDGSIWRSNSGGPCPNFGCWTKVGGPGVSIAGLPNEVVSSLTVDPTDANKIYVTYSGFNLSGDNHVYVSNSGGNGAWTQISDGLPDIPTHVLKVNPANVNMLWLGTDQGVFRSNNGGSSWESFGPTKGMPNVPVYDFAIDNFNGRVYAATHGRGVFMLTTQPVLYTFEGWMDGEIWDVLVYGEGYVPNAAISECTVDIILENGDICASGTVDSYGDAIVRIGEDGSLVTDRQFVWDGRPVIAACLNGNCVGGVNISNCLDPTNLIASVRVTCGGQVAFARISEDCPQQANPPSSVLDVESSTTPTGITCASTMSLSLDDFETGDGELDVMIALASTSPANGGDRILCGTRVPYDKSETPRQIAVKISEAINESASCSGENIVASVPDEILEESMGEDFMPASPRVLVNAPDLTAGQIIISLRNFPDQSTGRCFSLRNLGQFALNQLAIMRTTILTDESGANGGEIIFTESSHLGSCTISIPTIAGQSSEEIALAIYEFLTNMVAPGTLACESRQNPYDVKLEGASLVTVMADGLTICTTDPGIGFATGPDGLDLVGYTVDNQDDFEPSFAFSYHIGRTTPLGKFGNVTGAGIAHEIDIEYQFAPHFSIEALGGWYRFEGDYDLKGGAVFLKGYLTKKGLRPFASIGLGAYKPQFDNLSFGMSGGLGVNFPLFGNLEGEVGMNYHAVFTNNPNVSFFNTKAGIKFRF